MTRFARLTRPLFLLAAGLGALAATAQTGAAPAAKSTKNANWRAAVTATEGGHLIGNPDAPSKLVEYMSYTCSHCADFARTGEGAIKLLYVPTGKVSYEIRHIVRDPVDLTAALLTHCGDPKKFPANHEAFILSHDDWMAKARKTTQAQQTRWSFGTLQSRSQAIASDLDFYDIMERRGYSRVDTDRCLADEGLAKTLAMRTRADMERFGLRGTPSFVLGGKRLDATHDWGALQPHLDELF